MTRNRKLLVQAKASPASANDARDQHAPGNAVCCSRQQQGSRSVSGQYQGKKPVPGLLRPRLVRCD
jgi:hypothetical protein